MDQRSICSPVCATIIRENVSTQRFDIHSMQGTSTADLQRLRLQHITHLELLLQLRLLLLGGLSGGGGGRLVLAALEFQVVQCVGGGRGGACLRYLW